MDNRGIKLTIKTGVRKNITWLGKDNSFKYVILDRHTSDDDTDSFIAEMFNYMNVDSGADINSGISNMLICLEDTFAANGGLMFFDGGKAIYPQCCCGLEQLAQQIDAIERKEEFWHGHDPIPYQKYSNTELIAWSAIEIESKAFNCERISISFSFDELPDLLEAVIKDCYEFLTIVLRKRLTELGADEQNSDKLTLAFVKAFGYINENDEEVKLQRPEYEGRIGLPDKNPPIALEKAEEMRERFFRYANEYGFTFISPYCVNNDKSLEVFGFIPEAKPNGIAFDLVESPYFTDKEKQLKFARMTDEFGGRYFDLNINAWLGEESDQIWGNTLESWGLKK